MIYDGYIMLLIVVPSPSSENGHILKIKAGTWGWAKCLKNQRKSINKYFLFFFTLDWVLNLRGHMGIHILLSVPASAAPGGHIIHRAGCQKVSSSSPWPPGTHTYMVAFPHFPSEDKLGHMYTSRGISPLMASAI